jgi:hypothetical protein
MLLSHGLGSIHPYPTAVHMEPFLTCLAAWSISHPESRMVEPTKGSSRRLVLTLRMGHGVDGAGECVSVSEESVEVLGVKMTGPAWRGPAWVVDGQAEGRAMAASVTRPYCCSPPARAGANAMYRPPRTCWRRVRAGWWWTAVR